MRKGKYLEAICVMIMLMGIFFSISAFAETASLAKGTALEKKLYQAALKEGRLEWWDSLSLKEVATFIKEFGGKYPGIKIDYFEATSDVREEKYLTEFAAGRKTMDVTTIDLYDKFKEKGLLLDIKDIIKDANYPTKLVTEDLRGVTLEHVLIGTAYNTKLVQPKDVPRSWEDLLNPRWKGKKIGVESRFKLFIYNTPNWGQERTVKYLNRLKEQNPVFSKGASNTNTLLGAGEFPIAVGVYLHGILRDQRKGATVDWAPISPIIDKLSPFIVVREAPHPNAAKLFLRWLMSPEGQHLVDKVRGKGNPLPGSNTVQSGVVERLGIDVFTVAAWEVESIKGIEQLYGGAIGFKRK